MAGWWSAGEGDLEGGRVADVPGLVRQVHLVARQPPAVVSAERVVRRRRGGPWHPEQLGKADVVLPQRLALAGRQLTDEQLVEALGRVGDDRDRPQHQRGVERRVWGTRGRDAGVLGQLPDDALVEFADVGEHAIGLRPGTEVDRLERVAGVDEALERGQLGVRVLARADVVQWGERADAQRPLAVEEPDDALVVDAPEHRAAAREVAGICLPRPGHHLQTRVSRYYTDPTMPATHGRYGGVDAVDRVAARRARLVEAALSLLGTDGWPATTVRGICAHAKLTPRYFYESFADLDAILLAVFDAIAAESAAAVLGAVTAAPQDARAKSRAAIGAFVELLTDDPRKARVLFIEAMGSESLARRRFETVRMFARLVAEQARSFYGVPGETDPLVELTALMLAGGLAEAVLAWLDGTLAGPPRPAHRGLHRPVRGQR